MEWKKKAVIFDLDGVICLTNKFQSGVEVSGRRVDDLLAREREHIAPFFLLSSHGFRRRVPEVGRQKCREDEVGKRPLGRWPKTENP